MQSCRMSKSRRMKLVGHVTYGRDKKAHIKFSLGREETIWVTYAQMGGLQRNGSSRNIMGWCELDPSGSEY
jgi:hypothetical protein